MPNERLESGLTDSTLKCNGKIHSGYRPFLLGVLFFSLYLSYLVLVPFIHVLIIAIVLSSLFSPLQAYLSRLYGGRPNLAALSVIFILAFVLALPVFFFMSALVGQGIDTVNKLNEWLKSGSIQNLITDPRVHAYYEWAQEKLPFLDLQHLDISTHLLSISKNVGQFVLGKSAAILGNIVSLVTQFFIMVFIIFYMLSDGVRMLETARYYSPLRKEQEDRILDGVRVVARSVLLGSFFTAVSQGLVGGVGLALVGIPGVFWGTVMAFSSLIPLIGTALVWVPASVYLVLIGGWKKALFLVLWCIVLVGSIDNFLRPFLMRGQGKLSPFYIFLAIIGGVQYFGLIGVLYGPLILSFAMIMLYIYGVEYAEELQAGGKLPPDEELTDEGDGQASRVSGI